MNRGGFSWRRFLGISAFKASISRKIGIPLSRSGREQKAGRWMMQGGYWLLVAMVICILAMITTLCHAGGKSPLPPTGGYIQRNAFGGGANTFDAKGRQTGSIRENPITHTQDIYDKQGNQTGTIRPNAVIPGRIEVYDSRGRQSGYIEESIVPGTSNTFSPRGRQDGYLKHNQVLKDRIDVNH